MPTVPPAFVDASDIVDFRHPDVMQLARSLNADTPQATARRCFEWVRDDATPIDAAPPPETAGGFVILA
jgi:hypothetical protein